ncbi:MAG: PilZ domain-containing protein [Deltaproteobacteria bacterium]|nr:PilZ domain-containing protein [Deltaproteobacteria bacterium]
MARTDPGVELIRDRRSAPRIHFSFPVTLRDSAYEWKAEVLNISTTGALLKVHNQHAVGKSMEIELRPQGRKPERLRGKMVHVQPGGFAGFEFNVTRSEDYEITVDLFEWLMAQKPGLAVEVQKRPVVLAKTAILYPMPDSDVTPRADEAKFMTLFVGGRTLESVEKILGPRFESQVYLAFSLLNRGLLTMVQPGKYKGG